MSRNYLKMQCNGDWNDICLEKTLRSLYFAKNVWIRRLRHALGQDEFDYRYDKFYEFISSLQPGQFFVAEKAFKHDLWLGLRFVELYFQMDFYVNINYDKTKGIITILPPPTSSGLREWHPPNIFKFIRLNPEAWGVKKDHIFDV